MLWELKEPSQRDGSLEYQKSKFLIVQLAQLIIRNEHSGPRYFELTRMGYICILPTIKDVLKFRTLNLPAKKPIQTK